MALLTQHEKLLLETLRKSGRRERGGLTLNELACATRLPGMSVLEILVRFEQSKLLVSALVDDGRDEKAQRRLYYLSKDALA